MDGRQYEQPGPFGRAVEQAIARANKHVVPPGPLCGDNGCPLPAGHVERAGSPHLGSLFGRPIVPCGDTSPHPWHGDGTTYCEGAR